MTNQEKLKEVARILKELSPNHIPYVSILEDGPGLLWSLLADAGALEIKHHHVIDGQVHTIHARRCFVGNVEFSTQYSTPYQPEPSSVTARVDDPMGPSVGPRKCPGCGIETTQDGPCDDCKAEGRGA